MSDRKFNIICGHYGCGKSNYSINLALDMAGKGSKVMLVDLDLVNPYFLSSGYKEMLVSLSTDGAILPACASYGRHSRVIEKYRYKGFIPKEPLQKSPQE